MQHTALRYAAGSDVGVRSRNEDSAFASPRLLAVADGMGGHPHGDIASSTVTGVLLELDTELRRKALDPLPTLRATVATALRRLTELAQDNPDLALMGSTITALLWDGTGFSLAHVGDSRGYLLRDGELHQITTDHTLVQSLVDEGRITAEEAAGHSRRSMLTRALQAGGAAEPDLTPIPAAVGDRYLLCSDGVTCVVQPDAIRDVLCSAGDPAVAVRLLIEEAQRLDSPDNISAVVIDVVPGEPVADVLIVGAAADHLPTAEEPRQGWLRRLLS
ncbi:MAG TPA: protein phosphatase 2C domain-containing protein [Pseudonocardiaceae bacterium]|jgi:protein phosphatase|nr:protein phosphatase 2C domain-containing protein [Pseudonocardiaceae bacterium]